jgi:hypothetical protein
MTNQTLTFKGKATKNVQHVSSGVIYLHHFGTGWQELVFNSHDDAQRFAEKIGAELRRH